MTSPPASSRSSPTSSEGLGAPARPPGPGEGTCFYQVGPVAPMEGTITTTHGEDYWLLSPALPPRAEATESEWLTDITKSMEAVKAAQRRGASGLQALVVAGIVRPILTFYFAEDF